MKAIRRLFGPAAALSAVLAFAAMNAAAQNPCDDAEGMAALDAAIRNNYSKSETLETALRSAEEYLRKYGECEPREFSAWLKQNLEKWGREVEKRKTDLQIKKFDDAVRAKDFDTVYAVGGELVRKFPENVNFMLPMAMIGLPESYRKNYKYNDESLKHAKMALAKLKSGTAEPKKDKDGKPRTDPNGKPLFGPFQFERNAENAISELAYGLGYILYYAKNEKRAGLLYLYEASQLPGMYRTEPLIFSTIGDYYTAESGPIGKEIASLIERQKAATTDEEKVKLEAEIKSRVGMYNGYKDRALDAFGRAYRFADERIASEKALRTQLFTKLSALSGVAAKDRLDKIVAAAAERPFPDPTSAVAPIDDPETVAEPPSPSPSTVKPAPAKPKRPTVRRPRKPTT